MCIALSWNNCIVSIVLSSRDGVPYCEKDYQKSFGVRCAYCNRFISGKVLQVYFNYCIGLIMGEKDEKYRVLNTTIDIHYNCRLGRTTTSTRHVRGAPSVGIPSETAKRCICKEQLFGTLVVGLDPTRTELSLMDCLRTELSTPTTTTNNTFTTLQQTTLPSRTDLTPNSTTHAPFLKPK
jgi:hypothetical protein